MEKAHPVSKPDAQQTGKQPQPKQERLVDTRPQQPTDNQHQKEAYELQWSCYSPLAQGLIHWHRSNVRAGTDKQTP